MLPDTVEITVLEETPTHFYLVIPAKPSPDILETERLEPWSHYLT